MGGACDEPAGSAAFALLRPWGALGEVSMEDCGGLGDSTRSSACAGCTTSGVLSLGVGSEPTRGRDAALASASLGNALGAVGNGRLRERGRSTGRIAAEKGAGDKERLS